MQFPAEIVIGEHWSKISLHQLHSTLCVRLVTQVRSRQHGKHRYNSQAQTFLAITFLTARRSWSSRPMFPVLSP